MSDFIRRLEARLATVAVPLCVGLDPRAAEMTPDERALLETDPEAALLAHGRRLLAATSANAAAFKPNAAFYEVHGSAGWRALERLVPELAEVAPVILDAKRGDIGSTAEAYAASARQLGAHAVTLSPYLGDDAIAPFVKAGLFVFLLARTSNPSAAAIQDAGLVPLWERVVTARTEPDTALGFVVGATAPDVLAAVRRLAPTRWILAPGVGAQGADLAITLAAARGRVLVPISRAISAAADPAEAARRLVRDANTSHKSTDFNSNTARYAALVDGLFDSGCVRFGDFTLKSGLRSPIYLDLRRLVAFPALMTLAARAYADAMAALPCDRLAALPYAALPIGAAVSLATGRPMLYPRREAKGYGTRAAIEGVFSPGERALVLDDVATRGDSKLEAFERLEGAGLVVSDVLVLIDREGGASELMAAHGKTLHAVFRLRELSARWLATGRITASQAAAVEDFLTSSATPPQSPAPPSPAGG